MNADAWIGLAALVFTAASVGTGIVWRLARLETRVEENSRRLRQIERKMDNGSKRRLN